MKPAKLIHAEGPYEVYRAGHVLIIQRDGEFAFNLRKADNGFADPAGHIARILECERQVAEDDAHALEYRRADVAAYLQRRADRVAAQPQLF